MSLYQRGKSWYYNFTYRGQRYNACIGPVSKTRAKEILAKIKANVIDGRYELPSKKPSLRIDEFVLEYFDYYRANRRFHSARRHEVSWNAIRPVLGNKRLSEISPFELERYRRDRKKMARSDATINRELAFLRNLYNKAIDWGKATENPVSKIRFAKEHNERIRFLTLEEEDRLLSCCNPQLKPLVVTAVHSGFRSSELLSLTWGDIDFKNRIITVRAAYAKNGESRSVDMNDTLTSTLKAIRINKVDNGLVFRSRSGTPYRSFRTAFETAVRKSGIEDLTFHDLRRTFASRLVMAGVDLPTVKELMGHKDIKMTLRYSHLSSDHKQRAVRALDNFGKNLRQFSRQQEGEGNNKSNKLLKINTLS